MSQRRKYPIKLTVNSIKVSTVLISDHYEEKHSESINDSLILKLVSLLDNTISEPKQTTGDFAYYVNILEVRPTKFYKLIWLLENDKVYIGVVNVYRINKE